MSYERRWTVLWVFASLFWVGCAGSAETPVPQPSSSPAPPAVLGRGTLAVFTMLDRKHQILIFPPNGDKPSRELSLTDPANSLAFDRRGHLYYGFNCCHNEYFVREVDVRSGDRVRGIELRPSWSFSSVATDDHNVLYVNTKSFIGGDVKLFKPGEHKPYLEIKDPLNPLTIDVARDALWVGFQGALADGLARYRLRSTQQTWFQSVGNYLPTKMAVNPEGTLIAAKIRRSGKTTVSVYDVKSNKWTQIHEGDTQAMASDDSGNLYIAQRQGRILLCTFSGCPHSFETNLDITALALSPLDGMLYVAAQGPTGKSPGVYVYNPQTTSLVRSIPTGKELPRRIAIEP